MRLSKLPGWAERDDDADEQIARWARMTPAERWREVRDCAKDAMWAVRASPFPERVLAYEDPLPESTVEALRRLRTRPR
jgi:hypothetical protein